MKIAVIDHSYHKKTKSSDFFREIIEKKHIVVNFWDELWEGGNAIDINEINRSDFDAVVFLQYIKKPSDIRRLKCKNVVWIPMYDTEIIEWRFILRRLEYLFLNIKIISFSKALTSKFEKLGFNVLTVQYYPKPNFVEHNLNELTVLFWQRIEKINMPLIKKILTGNKIKKIIFKNNPDPYYKTQLPTKEEVAEFNITVKNGWLKEADYQELLNQCNIYIAPREYEGIGMAFLSAMATGVVVIAPNKPTMNEYIENGISGYLYDIEDPRKIDLSDIRIIQENIRGKMISGFNLWQHQQENILAYIEKPILKKNKEIKFILYCLFRVCNFIISGPVAIKRKLGIKFY